MTPIYTDGEFAVYYQEHPTRILVKDIAKDREATPAASGYVLERALISLHRKNRRFERAIRETIAKSPFADIVDALDA